MTRTLWLLMLCASIVSAQSTQSTPSSTQQQPQPTPPTPPLRPTQPNTPESAIKVEGQPAPPPANDVDLIWGLKIPMRDGVHLNGTVYTPHDQKEPVPVIFTLTPYIGDSYHKRALYFAQNGYVFVLVDVRGRG